MSPWTHGAVQHCKWAPAVIAALNRGDSPAFRPLPRSGYASRWFAISSAGTAARSAMPGRGLQEAVDADHGSSSRNQAAQSAAAETRQVRLTPRAPRLRSRLTCSVGAAAAGDGAGGGAGNDSATNSGTGSATFCRPHGTSPASATPLVHEVVVQSERQRGRSDRGAGFGACGQNLRLELRAVPTTRLRVDAHGCPSESWLDSIVCVSPTLLKVARPAACRQPTTSSNAGSSPGRWAARRGSSAAASWPASGRRW
jgi:hypothetical protein